MSATAGLAERKPGAKVSGLQHWPIRCDEQLDFMGPRFLAVGAASHGRSRAILTHRVDTILDVLSKLSCSRAWSKIADLHIAIRKCQCDGSYYKRRIDS